VSVAGAIADAIVAAVTALGLGPTVVRRKAPSLPQGQDPPQIVVSVGEEGDVKPLTAKKDMVRYPVAVTIVTGGGKKLADDETLRLWREQIRTAINQRATFVSVPQFNQVDPSGKPPFNPAAMAKDLNYSMLVFTVSTREARS
jgi:hypothetical protein